VFEEEDPDLFRLNPAGELLRNDAPASQRARALFTAGDLRWQLWSDFLESVRSGQAVQERAFGKSILQRHAENAEESALFNQAMTAYSAALSAPVIAAYDFSSLSCIVSMMSTTAIVLAALRRPVSGPRVPLHWARRDIRVRQFRANRKSRSYSMTSSARASKVVGIVMPGAFAVFRLKTIKYLDACSTGRSAGLVPLKILST
jgi:hypothetical protein